MDELEKFICGKRLGFGAFREVFELRANDAYVVKIAIDDAGRAVNLLENKIWGEISETPLAKWFAPVFAVSSSGKYLIQQKVEQLPKEQYPKKIPRFFTDTKYSNFGWLKGKGFVCCDFGSFNMFRGGSTKMVKVSWWE